MTGVTPHFADDHLTVYQGDAATVLASLPAESVHCVVTSPPYWGLRDYGVSGQLGLEPTPEEYVANLVAVFREVRRVLRVDGTLWLNLGDSYAGSYSGHSLRPEGGEQRPGQPGFQAIRDGRYPKREPNVPGLKPKDLVGIPWRVAFAFQADGWYLRSDIIWSKPNPMPESVTDRPTKAHEYLFLLSRSPRYYYDAEAVREASVGTNAHDLTGPGYVAPGQTPQTGNRRSKKPDGWATHEGGHGSFHRDGREVGEPGTIRAGRNLRDVWTIATEPYPGAHFATFPQKLVEPCVKVGTSERGVCPECGAPWRRETRATYDAQGRTTNGPRSAERKHQEHGTAGFGQRLVKSTETTGWQPGCAHGTEPVPATVLDPFAGSGTTGLVANRLGRRAVLIDLSMDYLGQLMDRNAQTPLGLGA